MLAAIRASPRRTTPVARLLALAAERRCPPEARALSHAFAEHKLARLTAGGTYLSADAPFDRRLRAVARRRWGGAAGDVYIVAGAGAWDAAIGVVASGFVRSLPSQVVELSGELDFIPEDDDEESLPSSEWDSIDEFIEETFFDSFAPKEGIDLDQYLPAKLRRPAPAPAPTHARTKRPPGAQRATKAQPARRRR